MPTATVTTKGQITIPADVRAQLGLRPGSRLAFVATREGAFEIHVQAASVRDLKGAVPAPARSVTLGDMDAAISAGAAGSRAARGPRS